MSLVDLPIVTSAQLKRHNNEQDCWVAIHGKVYNLTSFLPEHPAGKRVILYWAGSDATEEFDKFHSTSFLSSFLVPEAVVGVSEQQPPSDVPKFPTDKASPIQSSVLAQQHVISEWQKPPISSMLNSFDFEYVASRLMDREGWSYYSSGGDDEITLRENHAAFQRIWFRPRVLVDVKEVSIKSKILGFDSSFPVYITATALGKLAHPDGEVAFTRAAYNQGIIQMIPTLASCSLEEITSARQPGQTQFFQLYVNSNREVTKRIVQKAELLGCKALCITVDAPQLGRRERDMRNKFKSSAPTVQQGQGNINRNEGAARALTGFIDPSLSWKDIPWFRSITRVPLVLKGIQCGEDALLAVKAGVDAIILTNHGGRQLDYSRSGIEILPEVMSALRSVGAENKIEVWIDGGVRRGTDIFKALALGAKAVGVGRPFLYGLASYGQEGVERVIQLLKDELEMTMRLMGAPTLAHVNPEMLVIKDLSTHVTHTPDYLSEGTYYPLTPIGLAKL
eukprot:TRINITY_DN8171_c0_g1_i3.p1 TRINITY_DN8171_c0_g1~~TRINITY_DN8171_c0_g1_i3.p1  ORF type:complete len:507 (-),score=109.57 TRINITY_DN8171_c0_g1_i3:110-1630(-)